MTLYFDPARRVAALTPPPAVVKAPPQPTAGYFDPSKLRLVRSPYPSPQEIAAFVAALDAVTLRSVEGLKAHGETVLDLVTRRVAYVPRCACGALGGGEFGHRSHCLTIDRRPHWLRRKRSSVVEESEPYDGDPDDDLPF